jgi:hypothetical protein
MVNIIATLSGPTLRSVEMNLLARRGWNEGNSP